MFVESLWSQNCSPTLLSSHPFWKEIAIHNAGSYALLLGGQSIYVSYFQFCMGGLFFLPHLFIFSLSLLVLPIDIYLALCIIIQCCLILLLKLFQFCPLGTFLWLLCPCCFDYSHSKGHFFFSLRNKEFWHHKMLQCH